jgi:maleamate amidohydrolase
VSSELDDQRRDRDKDLEFFRERGFAGHSEFGSRPALLVIDMSNAQCDPAYGVGADLGSVIDAVEELLTVARAKGLFTVFTTLAYDPSMADAGVALEKIPAIRELVVGTPGAEIHPRLAPRAGEILLVKKRSSAFFMTELPALLLSAGIDTTIIVGVSTSGCIRHTAVDAMSYGFRVIVAEEAVGDRSAEQHHANLVDIQSKIGEVLPLADVLKHLHELPEVAP